MTQKSKKETGEQDNQKAPSKKREGPLALVIANLYGFSRRPGSSRLLGKAGSLQSLGNRVALGLIIAGLVSGFATYAALTERPPFGNDPNTVIWLLNLDLIILLLLLMIIARRIVGLWSGRRKKLAGSRLHLRLVFIFSLLAAAPAIIMTVFSAFFFHFGVQSWFSERVRTAVNESQAVAEAYLEEHQQVIRADVLAMAHDLDRQASILATNQEAFQTIMQTQSLLRNFSEAAVLSKSGQIIARSGMTYGMEQDAIPTFSLEQAEDGEVVVMTGSSDDRVRALVKLNNFRNAFLFVGRMADPVVLSHLADTRQAVQQYETLEGQRSELQITITMIFFVVALLLMFAAIWFGLIFARQLVSPISSLISASDRVRAGDLTARVPEFDRIDEFDVLARAFNRMTSQLQQQRDDLIAANRQLDERRRFTEAVLAGVSSGIVGIDDKGAITLANNSAAELFGQPAQKLTGKDIKNIVPETKQLLKQAMAKPDRITQAEIPYTGKDETKRILLVRIAVEMIGDEENGAVLTFDDITELQSAQRKAAWADVARRIAHEIKNPLTPIQLSAERLKRKYINQINEDADIFSQCTDTIISHVGDIGRMVNEFSAFARMPEPVMKDEDLSRHVRDMLVFLQQAHTPIEINFRDMLKEKGLSVARCDGQQMRQAVTNIVQNAIESVEARVAKDKEEGKKAAKGKIDVLLDTRDSGDEIIICVSDNGLGLPKNEDAAKLPEPYVTYKERGTGLGLAIVKKIMEDHHGRLVIGTPDWLKKNKNWEKTSGATVTLVLPAKGVDIESAEQAERIVEAG